MLRSMTGYGSAQAMVNGVDYSIEIRSVNGRYFKASLRLGEIWAKYEADIEKLLRKRLNRGSVNFSLRMRLQSEQAAHRVNAAVLSEYVRQVKEHLGDAATIDAAAMLQLPGVCEAPNPEQLCEAGKDGLFELINQAIDALLDMRVKEGQSLHQDLFQQCDAIAEQLVFIEPRSATVVEDFNNRLLTRVNELTSSAKLSVSEQDLVREVAIFAERSDINEEIQRLRGHIEQFKLTAESGEQAGRKLDFISQEMLREANTIGSKANDAEIAMAIVEIKTRIDRIKEQVQNAE